jgi:hypothetical protein
MAYKRKGPTYFKSALKNYNNMSEYSTKAVKFGEDEAPTKHLLRGGNPEHNYAHKLHDERKGPDPHEGEAPTKQMTKYSDIPKPTESDTNYSGDLYKKPSIVASDERKKSVREQVGDYNTSIDEYNEKVKMVGKYKKAKNMIKDALYVPTPRLKTFEFDYAPPYLKQMYSDDKGRISIPHSPKKK